VSSHGSRNSPEGRAEAASGSASTGQEVASGFTPTNAELAELLHRRDAWHKANLGTYSSTAIPKGGEGSGGKLSGVHGDSSLFENAEMALQSDDWPSIEEGIHAGKGA